MALKDHIEWTKEQRAIAARRRQAAVERILELANRVPRSYPTWFHQRGVDFKKLCGKSKTLANNPASQLTALENAVRELEAFHA